MDAQMQMSIIRMQPQSISDCGHYKTMQDRHSHILPIYKDGIHPLVYGKTMKSSLDHSSMTQANSVMGFHLHWQDRIESSADTSQTQAQHIFMTIPPHSFCNSRQRGHRDHTWCSFFICRNTNIYSIPEKDGKMNI